MSTVADAIRELQAELESDPQSVGALFFGSAQRGEHTTWSDLDVYVLHRGDLRWSEGRKASGFLIEASFSPVRCAQKHLADHNPIVTHAYATGAILFDRTGEVASLAEDARRRWVAGPPPAAPADRLRWQFRLTDLTFDLRDLPESDPDAFAIASVLVQWAIEAACASAGRWLPPRKGMLRALQQDDPVLAAHVLEFYRLREVAAAIAVGQVVLDTLGGELTEYKTESRPC